MSRIKILFVDDEPDILELICFFTEANFDAAISTAPDGDTAIKLLGQETFDVVVSDYNMPSGNGGKVFLHIQTMAQKPHFILLSSTSPNEKPEFSKGIVAGHAEKPLFSASLKTIIESLYPESILSKTTAAKQSVNLYCRIKIPLIHSMNVLPCDLYLKLSDKKMLKVMNKGDVFGDVDKLRFITKGITYLYLEGSQADSVITKIISELTQQAEMRLAAKQYPEQYLVSEALQDTIHDLALGLGFSPMIEQAVRANMNATLGLVKNKPELAKLLSNTFLNPDNYSSSHSVLLSYIVCGLAELMEWQSNQTFQKLTIAALLHDSLLVESTARIQSLVELEKCNLSVEEKTGWKTHMTKAAEIAKQFKEIPPDVDQIITQHHEQPDGSGYPHQLPHNRIAPLAMLFIVSHDFLCFYEQTKKPDIVAFAKKNNDKYNHGQFKRILNTMLKGEKTASKTA